MKPINTKERSKLFSQFLFIVFGLCFLPIAIIFAAYYQTPVQISQEQQEKLNHYSEFADQQKVLAKQLADIDSNIMVLNNGSNVNLLSAEPMISTAIARLTSTDSTKVVKAIGKAYTNYLNTAHNLNLCTTENKKLNADLVATQGKAKELESDKKTRDMIDAVGRH